MANALLSPKVYARAGLKLLKNNLVAAKLVDGQFNNEFKKVGDTVYAKRPPEFVVRSGAVAVPQDVIEGEVPIVIDKQRGVDIQFTSIEETLTVDSLLKSRAMNAAMAQLAQEVDSSILQNFTTIPSWVGTPGQTVDSATDFMLAPQRLANQAVPMDNLFALLSPSDHYGLAGNFVNLNTQEGIATNALRKAALPMIAGVDPYMTQSVVNLTTGSRTNGAVNGASQNTTYLATKATYTQTLNVDGIGTTNTVAAGDVFTIANVYAVNPRTKAALPYLQQFTTLEDRTASSGAIANLQISPPIIASGAFQNVSAAPADDAVLTWLGSASTTYRPSAAFHKTAIKLVSAKLIRPYSGEADFAHDPETGITVRYWRYSNGDADTHNHRWDVMFGTVNADRRLGVRLSGS